MAKKVLTHTFCEPLGSWNTVKVDIHAGDGNLGIGSLSSAEPVLARGELQYLENQALPTQRVETSGGKATLTLRSGGKGQPWLRLPWAACNGATQWQIQLAPGIAMDLLAHTDGGNVKLDLADLTVTRIQASTDGGNVEVSLPDRAAGLSAVLKSGAGNVDVSVPSGVAFKIHATTGLGKVVVGSQFQQTAKDTYQSRDYDTAVAKAELTLSSGAGNVIVKERVAQPETAASRF